MELKPDKLSEENFENKSRVVLNPVRDWSNYIYGQVQRSITRHRIQTVYTFLSVFNLRSYCFQTQVFKRPMTTIAQVPSLTSQQKTGDC